VRLPNNQKIATQNPFLPREIVAFLPCSSILVLFLLFFRIFSHPVLFIFAPHNVFKIKLVSPFGQHDTFTFHFEQGRELKIKNHFSPNKVLNRAPIQKILSLPSAEIVWVLLSNFPYRGWGVGISCAWIGGHLPRPPIRSFYSLFGTGQFETMFSRLFCVWFYLMCFLLFFLKRPFFRFFPIAFEFHGRWFSNHPVQWNANNMRIEHIHMFGINIKKGLQILKNICMLMKIVILSNWKINWSDL